jgi:hypothetical protein
VITKVGFSTGAKLIVKEGAIQGSKKILTKAGIAKLTGSTTRAAIRSWACRKGLAKGGEILHHCFIAVNSPTGRRIPEVIKNQPWNLLKVVAGKGRSAMEFHQALHGVGTDPFNAMERLLFGTPHWSKAAVVSTAGHAESRYGP